MAESLEDQQTVLYLQDTCHQAGYKTKLLSIEEVGFDTSSKRFVDLQTERIEHLFKLYPWEWMWESDFADQLKLECAGFMEPMWKMLVSTKGLLPILWKLHPGHPNL